MIPAIVAAEIARVALKMFQQNLHKRGIQRLFDDYFEDVLRNSCVLYVRHLDCKDVVTTWQDDGVMNTSKHRCAL
jgi:hypothetical protein